MYDGSNRPVCDNWPPDTSHSPQEVPLAPPSGPTLLVAFGRQVPPGRLRGEAVHHVVAERRRVAADRGRPGVARVVPDVRDEFGCRERGGVRAGAAVRHAGPGVSLAMVVDEPLVAVVAPGEPLLLPEGRTEVPLAGLADRPLISLPRGTGLRGVLDEACAEAGFRPRIAFEAASSEVLTRLAARGLGVAVLPALPEEMTAGLGLRALTITDPRPRGRIALTWRTDGPPTPAAQALLSTLRKHLTTGAP